MLKLDDTGNGASCSAYYDGFIHCDGYYDPFDNDGDGDGRGEYRVDGSYDVLDNDDVRNQYMLSHGWGEWPGPISIRWINWDK